MLEKREPPGAAPTDQDHDHFLAEHPDLDTLEVIVPDTNGVLRGKWLPGDATPKVMREGIAFPFSIFGLDVWGREVDATRLHIESGDKDGVCRPVPGTLRIVPWAERKTAQVLLTMFERDGSPYEIDPRQVLSRMVGRMAERGLTATAAFELEFYLFKEETLDWNDPRPVFGVSHGPARQNMYALSDLEALTPVIRDIRQAAILQGIAADAAVSEAAPGQFEVNLHHRSDALAAADDAVLLRRLISRVARKHGIKASFMAKPFADWPGSGMHLHISVQGADGNIFSGAEGDARLEHSVGGLLDTMPDAQALFVSTYNGFRRMQPGSYAPTAINWGHDNRTVAVRIPVAEGPARRIEHRIAGADANPYLVMAGILAGLMEGLEAGRSPPPPVEGNAYEQARTLLTARMDEALDVFAASERMRAALGAEMHRVFLAIKRDELAELTRDISRLERETYL